MAFSTQPHLLPLLPAPTPGSWQENAYLLDRSERLRSTEVKMTSGLCSSIGCSMFTSKEACAQAGNDLGFNTAGGIKTIHTSDDRPPGCFAYRNYKIEFNTRLTSKAIKSDMEQVCDCSPGPEPPFLFCCFFTFPTRITVLSRERAGQLVILNRACCLCCQHLQPRWLGSR